MEGNLLKVSFIPTFLSLILIISVMIAETVAYQHHGILREGSALDISNRGAFRPLAYSACAKCPKARVTKSNQPIVLSISTNIKKRPPVTTYTICAYNQWISSVSKTITMKEYTSKSRLRSASSQMLVQSISTSKQVVQGRPYLTLKSRYVPHPTRLVVNDGGGYITLNVRRAPTVLKYYCTTRRRVTRTITVTKTVTRRVPLMTERVTVTATDIITAAPGSPESGTTTTTSRLSNATPGTKFKLRIKTPESLYGLNGVESGSYIALSRTAAGTDFFIDSRGRAVDANGNVVYVSVPTGPSRKRWLPLVKTKRADEDQLLALRYRNPPPDGSEPITVNFDGKELSFGDGYSAFVCGTLVYLKRSEGDTRGCSRVTFNDETANPLSTSSSAVSSVTTSSPASIASSGPSNTGSDSAPNTNSSGPSSSVTSTFSPSLSITSSSSSSPPDSSTLSSTSTSPATTGTSDANDIINGGFTGTIVPWIVEPNGTAGWDVAIDRFHSPPSAFKVVISPGLGNQRRDVKYLQPWVFQQGHVYRRHHYHQKRKSVSTGVDKLTLKQRAKGKKKRKRQATTPFPYTISFFYFISQANANCSIVLYHTEDYSDDGYLVPAISANTGSWKQAAYVFLTDGVAPITVNFLFFCNPRPTTALSYWFDDVRAFTGGTLTSTSSSTSDTVTSSATLTSTGIFSSSTTSSSISSAPQSITGTTSSTDISSSSSSMSSSNSDSTPPTSTSSNVPSSTSTTSTSSDISSGASTSTMTSTSSSVSSSSALNGTSSGDSSSSTSSSTSSSSTSTETSSSSSASSSTTTSDSTTSTSSSSSSSTSNSSSISSDPTSASSSSLSSTSSSSSSSTSSPSFSSSSSSSTTTSDACLATPTSWANLVQNPSFESSSSSASPWTIQSNPNTADPLTVSDANPRSGFYSGLIVISGFNTDTVYGVLDGSRGICIGRTYYLTLNVQASRANTACKVSAAFQDNTGQCSQTLSNLGTTYTQLSCTMTSQYTNPRLAVIFDCSQEPTAVTIYLDDIYLNDASSQSITANYPCLSTGLTNGCFEKASLTPWQSTPLGAGASGALTTSVKHSGLQSFSLVVSGAGQSETLSQNNVPGQALKPYTLTLWYQFSRADASCALAVGLAGLAGTLTATAARVGVWTKYTATYVSAGSDIVTITLSCSNPLSAGVTAYVDDISTSP